ncbi:AzlC family ABC transporter permease [Pseudokineococcus sp. 1T1Z-3]|uniref:AzlC family ABC transporter permease n=1 Tax=Pseudokineococcus sp. 1T1Z-3 TaxID=3132745 RepID=UPI0030B03666
MRSARRTEATAAVLRDAAVAACAGGVVGVAFGAVAVAGGLPAWVPVLMSVAVFAGSAQLLLAGLLVSGAAPAVAAAAALVVNLRHVPYGMALADVLDHGSLPRRLLARHLLVDESTALALAQPGGAPRRLAYWAAGLGLFVTWNLGVLTGSLAGRGLDTTALGLDAALPALLLALVLPSLRADPAVRRAAAAGAVVALALSLVAPAGTAVLAGLLGLLALGRRTSPSPGGTGSRACAAQDQP